MALEVGELDFGAAAVDGAVNGFVDLDAVLATFAAAIFDDGGGRGGAELDVEIAEDVAAVGANADVGFEVGGEGDVDIPVEGAEGHGLLRIDAEEIGADVAVEGVGDGAAGNVVQGDGAVDVVDVELAIDAGDYDVAVVDGAELERSVRGDGDGDVDGVRVGIGVDADVVVFFLNGEAGAGDGEALGAAFVAVSVVIARAGFDDDFLAVVGFDGDAAVDQADLDAGRARGIAESYGNAIAAGLRLRLRLGGLGADGKG